MVGPQRAAVVPRVLSEISGDPFPIEEMVAPHLGETGLIALVGSEGAGKTTALEHLAATMPGQLLLFDDDTPLQRVEQAGRTGLALYACEDLCFRAHVAILRLAPWGRDEALDYLMAACRDTCGDVMRRLAADPDVASLGGNAELWRAALDRMAAGAPGILPALAQVATRAALADRILRHEVLRSLREAHQVSLEIRDAGECPSLGSQVPQEVLRAAARLLADAAAAAKETLARLCEGPADDRQPMAASLLLALDPAWKPRGVPRLDGAYLEGARWRGVELRAARLVDADLDGADLDAAVFDGAYAFGASFRGADFSGASLSGAHCRGLDFRVARLDGANFSAAHLEGCHFEGVHLRAAKFDHADLHGASLTGSDLPRACFRDARLGQARVADVSWEGADLRGADLTGAIFHMGSSRGGLVGSFLASEGTRTGFYTDEYDEQHFKSPEEIRKANLRGADLRGARVEQTDFYLVDLRDAAYDDVQAAHFRRCGAILRTKAL